MFVDAVIDYDDAYLQRARRGARVLAEVQLGDQQVVVPPLHSLHRRCETIFSGTNCFTTA